MTPRHRPPHRPRKRRREATAPASRGALRVVAGAARGLRLDVPAGSTTRPTAGRVREAIFNALGSLDATQGARAIDAFAGSGALGIEALSRGADHVTFVEVDPAARAVIGANLAHTGLADRATVTGGDGPRAAAAAGPWDLMLLDPPYAFAQWDSLLTQALAGLAHDGVLVVESDREVELPAGLHRMRTKQYGSTVVTFATPTGAHL